MPAMNHSRMPDDWVQKAVASAPFTKLPNGGYRTCPGRAAFEYVNKPNDERRGNDGKMLKRDKPQYELTWLGPPGSQEQINSVLWPDVYGLMKEKAPNRFDPSGKPIGMHIPWRDQGERISQKTGGLHNGMTPGLPLMRFISEFPPQMVDINQNPILGADREKALYPGCWVVVLFNFFWYSNLTTGAGCGLNGLMIVGDDDTLAGGGPDLKQAFAGVKLEARFDAVASFGTAPGGVPPAPGSFLPPPQAVNPGITPPPAPPAPAAAPMSLEAMLGRG